MVDVLNLVVQRILLVLNTTDDPSVQDYYELLNKQYVVHYDLANENEDLQAMQDDDYTGNYDNSKDLVEDDTTFGGLSAIDKVC